jgi:two-component system, OmpR family, response regulator
MDQKTKLLLAEDDENLGLLLKEYLVAKGFEADLFSDGEAAYKGFMKAHYDICILDIMMPKKDGFSLAKDIRVVNKDIPIIFLTAKNLKDDVIEGFKLGADDYITKPFSMEEFILRLEAILKRSKSEHEIKKSSDDFYIGNFNFCYPKLSLTINNNNISLTAKEAEILKMLCQQKGDIVKREQILNKIWGTSDYFSGRSLDVFITKLRKYLKQDTSIKITNVHGVGFKLEEAN